MEFAYRRAEIADMELLVKTRIEVLKAANGLADDADMSAVERETAEYYTKSFTDNSHAAYLVFCGDQLAGCGGVSFYEVMPTYRNPSGKCAYIMNMYTKPDYRRRGIATKVLGLLIDEAGRRGVRRITLEATGQGRSLYEKNGFIALNREMIYES